MLTSHERETLAALVDTLIPDGVPRDAVLAASETALERLAAHRRSLLLRFLGLLDGRALGIAFSGNPRRFTARTKNERERILLRLADHRVPALRSGFTAFKRLILFVAYGHSEDDGNPLWPRIGYPGPRSDVPAYLPTLRIANSSPQARADAVIVGSGAGGGVAAALLAEAGYDTIILEAGPAADAVAHTQREAHAVSSLYLDSGLAATDDVAVSLLAGACVGGGTTVNWCTSLRLDSCVAEEWTHASGVAGLASELDDAYQRVEARLALATSPHNANNAVIARGCRRLDWPVRDIPRNASGCGDGCGYCGFGCAYGNKRGTAMTYLVDAQAAGARIFAGARVDRVRVRRGVVAGVDACVDGRTVSIDAPLVVVAAGALRTPAILARSGVRSRHLGRHLRVHPVSGVAAEFDEPIEPWRGPMQTALCDRYGNLDGGYGVRIECAPAHPGLAALAIPWRGAREHRAEMERFRSAATLIALTRDRGEGRVSLDGRDDVHYRLDPYDAAHLQHGLIAAAALSFAAGARRVTTFHSDPLVLEREAASRGALQGFADAIRARGMAPNRIILFSAHQMGTARMSARPRDGVIDATGAVHGVEGLLVADGSAFPLSSGVNPMLTIMALAHRTVRRALCGRYAPDAAQGNVSLA